MKRLLIIGLHWPEPSTTAAGTRMMQLIRFFLENKYQITFACSIPKTTYSYNLNSLGIKTVEIELNNSSFDSFIRQLKPHIVLFDQFITEEQFGWRVADNYPDAVRILDTEDLHFLRLARELAFKKKEKINLINDTTKREIASIYRSDLSLIISKSEMVLLKKEIKIDSKLLHYIPFLQTKIAVNTLKKFPNFKERQHFITMGNFKHKPNYESVLYLKKEIWPKIRKKLPKTELHVYGAYSNERIKQMHNQKEGFIIKGWANNKEEVYKNSRVFLAPLLFGAGLKGKLIDSMIYGTPNITTTIGAEGMTRNSKWNGFIEDNSEEFAQKAVELYNHEEKWLEFQKNGKEIINNCFNKNKFDKKLQIKINEISSNLKEHREHNFIGQILQYHTLKSTQYLSKYIEEKERKR
ncbi:MAG: glycosyltransferase [Lutibacter sp.]|uniref:glycosyltransferase n=1 Tax=Lutibacter sp. TaxID=1925666 RepID=UPI00299D5CB6|nr:glycosyltransferase [Lutibacter sp.]MDX1828048.1 glycosyltransferase [Lutibacter sp.]